MALQTGMTDQEYWDSYAQSDDEEGLDGGQMSQGQDAKQNGPCQQCRRLEREAEELRSELRSVGRVIKMNEEEKQELKMEIEQLKQLVSQQKLHLSQQLLDTSHNLQNMATQLCSDVILDGQKKFGIDSYGKTSAPSSFHSQPKTQHTTSTHEKSSNQGKRVIDDDLEAFAQASIGAHHEEYGNQPTSDDDAEEQHMSAMIALAMELEKREGVPPNPESQ